MKTDSHKQQVPGTSYSVFLVDYYYGSRKFSFDLLAENWDDAQARLYAIKESAWVEGQLLNEMPAATPTWAIRVWCGIKNIFFANVRDHRCSPGVSDNNTER